MDDAGVVRHARARGPAPSTPPAGDVCRCASTRRASPSISSMAKVHARRKAGTCTATMEDVQRRRGATRDEAGPRWDLSAMLRRSLRAMRRPSAVLGGVTSPIRLPREKRLLRRRVFGPTEPCSHPHSVYEFPRKSWYAPPRCLRKAHVRIVSRLINRLAASPDSLDTIRDRHIGDAPVHDSRREACSACCRISYRSLLLRRADQALTHGPKIPTPTTI